ncbi:hypothetical protein ANRL2_01333 [Anaerolineae bacterium]|nr:hypothetical protein ANRL2_01333 [Anaerolineae bacterium]
MKMSTLLAIGIFLLVAGVIGLLLFFPPMGDFRMPGIGDGMMDGMMGAGRERRYASAGERIYQAGIGSDGRPIRNSHGMEGVGCAMCHGRNGQGVRMMMMEVPSLDWNYLSSPGGHRHPGRSHPPFTEATFNVCVLAGKDPAGNTLSAMMPRWEMSESDMDRLIEYLKSIDKG